MSKSKIGDRIREIRMMHKMRQSEFAEFIGTTQGNVSYLENLETIPSAHLMQKIADRLPEINWNWLITNKGTPFMDGYKPKPIEREESQGPRMTVKGQAAKDHEVEVLKKQLRELKNNTQEEINKEVAKRLADLSKSFLKKD